MQSQPTHADPNESDLPAADADPLRGDAPINAPLNAADLAYLAERIALGDIRCSCCGDLILACTCMSDARPPRRMGPRWVFMDDIGWTIIGGEGYSEDVGDDAPDAGDLADDRDELIAMQDAARATALLPDPGQWGGPADPYAGDPREQDWSPPGTLAQWQAAPTHCHIIGGHCIAHERPAFHCYEA